MSFYTVRLLDIDRCEIAVDDVRGLVAAKDQARDWLRDPEMSVDAWKAEVLDRDSVCVYDVFAEGIL